MKSRSSKPWKFQSTHSCRVRLINCVIWRKNAEFQSTHSCRVRRNQTTMTDEEMGDFNPRTRVECDDAATSNNKSCKVFQSTHSCRVRLYVTSGSTRPRYFNPRTRVECDCRKMGDIHFKPLFQSTHSCRVRQSRQYDSRFRVPISIHALV